MTQKRPFVDADSDPPLAKQLKMQTPSQSTDAESENLANEGEESGGAAAAGGGSSCLEHLELDEESPTIQVSIYSLATW